MEAKLGHLATLSQKDKTPAYISLLSETLSRPDPSSLPADFHVLIDAVANPDIVGLVTGRQVISELVKSIGAGAITDHDIRKRIVQDALATLLPRIASYEEQVIFSAQRSSQILSQSATPSGQLPAVPARRSLGNGRRMDRGCSCSHECFSRLWLAV